MYAVMPDFCHKHLLDLSVSCFKSHAILHMINYAVLRKIDYLFLHLENCTDSTNSQGPQYLNKWLPYFYDREK